MVQALSPAARVLIRLWILRLVPPLVAVLIDLGVWGGANETRLGVDAPVWVVVTVAVLAYATLAVLERPLIGYAALFLFALGGIVLMHFESFLGFALALFAMARRTAPLPARMALLGSAVPITVNAVNGGSFQGPLDPSLAASLGGIWLLLFGAVWLAGRTLARGEDRVAHERERAAQLRAEALKSERLRISRELHDIVGHSLTAIVLQAAGVTRGLQTGTATDRQVTEALEAIQQTGSQSMRELHRLLGLMREERRSEEAVATQSPPSLDELRELLAAGRAAGFVIDVLADGEPQALDPSVERAVSRILQEGLSNAMKYAEPGARIEIRRHWAPGRLEVSITNPMSVSKRALEAFRGGYGLLGLRERVHIIGGSVVAESAEGRFVLRATLPTVARADTPDGFDEA